MCALRSMAMDGGWSAIALTLKPADPQRGGFELCLVPDTGKPPSTVFLRPQQVLQLLEMAASSSHSDQELWELLSRVPLEPLLPSRGMAARLRWLLVEQAGAVRELARSQLERLSPPTQQQENLADTEPHTDPAKFF